jgi:ParB family transcriptional regulator, chromosome partitioning protein
MTEPAFSKGEIPMHAKRIETRRLDDLKSHPRQADFFSDLNEGEFEKLKQSLAKRLDFPIEITTENVVIDGHQRLRAARELGWKEIQVWVRDDLTDQQEIDQRHIEANLDRRQLNRLEQARLIKALCEMERSNRPRRHDAFLGDVRDRIGKRFGIDGRTAQRWMNLLETPQVVQEAVSKGKLPMILAEKVSHLIAELKQHVADRIQGGEDPARVVKEVLAQQGKPGKQPKRLPKSVEKLAKIAKLLEKVDVDANLSVEDAKQGLDVLSRCSERCRALAGHLERPVKAVKADSCNNQSVLEDVNAA